MSKTKLETNDRLINLDYLRAFAVIFVILSHVPFITIKSGAVNIFFVLTGYFIARSLNYNYKNRIFQFYLNRLSLLIPKMVLIGIIVLTLWPIIFPTYNYETLIKSFLTSSIGNYNYYLIGISEFYENQKIINPYLPLWAFSLILQFYVFSPPVLKSISSFYDKVIGKKDHKWLIFAVITIVLFSYQKIFINDDLVKFYSTQSRLWEFFLGVTCFYISLRPIKESIKRDFQILGFIGLIIWATIPNTMISNELNILFVVIATGLYILGSNSIKIKESKIFAFLGKSSFDLYIIHYPLLFLFSVLNFAHIWIFIMYLGILISVAIFMHQFFNVELVKRISKFSVLGVIAILVILNFYVNSMKFVKSEELNPTKFGNSAEQMFDKTVGVDGHPCLDNADWETNCSFLVEKPIGSIFLVGTSQAEVFSEGLRNFASVNSLNFYDITKGGCPFLLGFDQIEIAYDQIRKGCADLYFKNVLNKIKETSNSIVIYHSRMPYYLNNFTEYKDYGDGSVSNSEVPWKYVGVYDSSKILTPSKWRESLQQLNAASDNLILIYPIPEFPRDFTQEIVKSKEDRIKVINYEVYKLRSASSKRLFDQVLGTNVYRVYPYKYLCQSVVPNSCIGNTQQEIFYTDESHFSRGGVNLVFPDIEKELSEITSRFS